MYMRQLKRVLAASLLGTACVIPGLAEAARTVPVTVENLPDVVTTQDRDNPAFQPMQFSSSDFINITNPNTLLFTGESADPVPAGKRLVVQHISFQIRSDDMTGTPRCTARVLDDTTEVVTHPLPMTISIYRTDQKNATVSLPLTMYAEAGMEVGVSCAALVGDDVSESFGVTGYFVDL